MESIQFQEPQPRGRWDTVWLLVAGLAAVFSAATQYQSHPVYAVIFLAVVALAVAAKGYRPVAARIRIWKLQGHRNRIAQKAWPDLLRFEKRLAEFLNNNDSRNLRYIINDVGGHVDDELFKICAPDYLEVFYRIISTRHFLEKRVREKDFRLAATEFISMVSSHNTEYVLKPMRRLKESSRFKELAPEMRKHREEAIEDFRERWAGLLDDLIKFVETANNDFGYEQYQETIHVFFERPKRLSL